MNTGRADAVRLETAPTGPRAMRFGLECLINSKIYYSLHGYCSGQNGVCKRNHLVKLGCLPILMKKQLTDIQIDAEMPSHRILFLDGAYFESVDANCIPKLGLRIGLEIEPEVLQKLIEADEGIRAKHCALELLSNQSYSKSQMVYQLRQRGFGTEAIDITLEDLEQLGHIKDEHFAKRWIARRQRSKPKGKKVLAHELANQSIDKATVDRVLSGINHAEETDIASQLARKQAKRYQSLPPEVAKRRLHGFLHRRGFDYETIQSVIERVLIKGNRP